MVVSAGIFDQEKGSRNQQETRPIGSICARSPIASTIVQLG
jgi:hypothetical protein